MRAGRRRRRSAAGVSRLTASSTTPVKRRLRRAGRLAGALYRTSDSVELGSDSGYHLPNVAAMKAVEGKDCNGDGVDDVKDGEKIADRNNKDPVPDFSGVAAAGKIVIGFQARGFG